MPTACLSSNLYHNLIAKARSPAAAAASTSTWHCCWLNNIISSQQTYTVPTAGLYLDCPFSYGAVLCTVSHLCTTISLLYFHQIIIAVHGISSSSIAVAVSGR